MRRLVGFLRLARSGVAFSAISLGSFLPLCLVTTTQSALAQDASRAVRLSDVYGTVRIMIGEQTEFQPAYANMPLPEGTRVQTGNDGRAELQLEDGSIVRVTPNSTVYLEQLSFGSDGSKDTLLRAIDGLSYFELQPRTNTNRVAVVYQEQKITPLDSSVFRINGDNLPGELNILSGKLWIEDKQGHSGPADAPVRLVFGSYMSNGQWALGGQVTKESWDRWNAERDQALNQEASNQTEATASVADRDNPAWNDLNTYGNWYDVPGYGNVWTPSGVDANWDPYGYGYWAWYPNSGYLWVSRYNWGYLPYRCGAWNYFNDYGWGWIPGGCGGRYFGPGRVVIWNPPPRYVIPQRPLLAGAPIHGRPIPAPLIPIDRGGRYHPQPVGIGNGLRPPVSIGGVTARPLPPVIAPGHNGLRPVPIEVGGDRKPGFGMRPVRQPVMPSNVSTDAPRSLGEPSTGAAPGSSTLNPPSGLRPPTGQPDGGNAARPPAPSPVVRPPVRIDSPALPPRVVMPPSQMQVRPSSPMPSAPVHISPPAAPPRAAPMPQAPRMSAPPPASRPSISPPPARAR